MQAQHLGLVTHQMAGFHDDRVREVLSLPPDHEPVSMIAIGHPASEGEVPAELQESERAPRSRRALGEILFGAAWGEPFESA